MKSTKIFFESGYYRVEISIAEIEASGSKPKRLVMKYVKKPIAASVPMVGSSIEYYDSQADDSIPDKGENSTILRHFRRVIRAKKIAPDNAFTREGCLLAFFKNIETWNGKKKSLL